MIKKKKIFLNEQPRFRAGLSCRQELASSVTWLKSYNLSELHPLICKMKCSLLT